jgi:hypothetical protein
MSSDFGTNKRRVDIKLNCPDGLKTWKAVVAAVLRGDHIIRTAKTDNDIPDSVWTGGTHGQGTCIKVGCYSNSLCKELRSHGIDDIRFGSLPDILGGVGYTLYKP